MPALSLRLPDELEHRLVEEAHREGVPRSEVARQAISDYLARRERERFMTELVADKEKANFCELFDPTELSGSGLGQSRATDLLQRAQDLFK